MTNKFKSAYQETPRHHPQLDPISLTHQSMAPECDINTIMRRYEKTGILEHRNNFEGQYGDFTSATDYHTSMNQVIAANDMFETLPARLRKRFHNDPALFLEFTHNPDNAEEIIKLGLAVRRPTEDVLDDPSTSPKTTPKQATPPATGSTQTKSSGKNSPDDA